MRAIGGQPSRPMTSMMFQMLGPSTETSVMMMISDGKASTMSASRMIVESTQPP